MERTDFELAQAFAGNQDSPAFEELVDRHAGLVYHLALRISGNHHEAEDVTQDVFMEMLRNLGRFEKGRSFRAWAAAFTVRIGLKTIRKNQRARTRERRAGTVKPSQQPDQEPLSDLEREELIKDIEARMEELSPDTRIPMVLHYLEGMTYAEVGEAMGIPEGTAKSRVSRGLDQVRETVGAGQRRYSAAMLLPLLGKIPSPAAPKALVLTLKALPAKMAAAGAVAAPVAAAAAPSATAAKTTAVIVAVAVLTLSGVALVGGAAAGLFSGEELMELEEPASRLDVAWENSPSGANTDSETRGESSKTPAPEKPRVEPPAEVETKPEPEPAPKPAMEDPVKVRKLDPEEIKRFVRGGGKVKTMGLGGGRSGGGSSWSRAGYSHFPRRPVRGSCTVRGRVVDSARNPVAGADLYWMKQDAPRGKDRVVSFRYLTKFAATDSAGFFADVAFPEGDFYLVANYHNVMNRRLGLDTTEAVSVSLVKNQKLTGLLLSLPKAVASLSSLEGRVLDEGLNPVVRAEVTAGFMRVYTDSKGVYRIPSLAAGEVEVRASRTGYRQGKKKLTLVGGSVLKDVDIVLSLLHKGDHSVSGTVCDKVGAPVAGANVYVMGERRTLRSGRTDGAGGFRFDNLHLSEVRLQVSKNPGFLSWVQPVSLSATDVNVVLTKKVTLSGFVHSETTGDALQQLRMTLYRENSEGERLRVGGQCRYTEDGSFTLYGPAGRLFIQAEAPDHDKAVFEIEMPLEGSEFAGLELKLAKSKGE